VERHLEPFADMLVVLRVEEPLQPFSIILAGYDSKCVGQCPPAMSVIASRVLQSIDDR